MKKLGKVFTAFVLMLSLTGCMKLDMTFEVKDLENITLQMSMYVEEELLKDKSVELYKSMRGAATLSDFEEQQLRDSINIDDLIDKMEESVKDDFNTSETKFTRDTKKIDNQEWKGFTMSGVITGDDAKKILQEKDGVLTFTLPLDDMDNSYSSLYNYSSSDSEEALKEIQELGLEMQFTIVMPSNATASFGKVDGKKVTIDIFDYVVNGNAKDIVITSSTKSANTGLYIGIGAVAVIAVVAIVLFMKNKNKKVPIEVSGPIESNKPQDTSSQPGVDDTLNKQD